MNQNERFLDPTIPDEMAATIRPKSLADFIGHESLKQNLSVFISGARSRGEAMDHVLLYGPPGLGKTTLAHIIANELGTNFRTTAAPMLTKQGDLAAILTALEPMDVLFIDEIHRLPTAIEEVLYSAMEDFKLDIMLGEGPSAKSVRIDLPPFTLVGATTRTGLLSNPLRDRFGIDLRLSFYSPSDLAKIIKRSANILGTDIDEDAALMLATSSRGTPRIANRLLKRARDFAAATNTQKITVDTVKTALFQLHVDARGLDEIDREKEAWKQKGLDEVKATKWAEEQKRQLQQETALHMFKENYKYLKLYRRAMAGGGSMEEKQANAMQAIVAQLRKDANLPADAWTSREEIAGFEQIMKNAKENIVPIYDKMPSRFILKGTDAVPMFPPDYNEEVMSKLGTTQAPVSAAVPQENINYNLNVDVHGLEDVSHEVADTAAKKILDMLPQNSNVNISYGGG